MIYTRFGSPVTILGLTIEEAICPIHLLPLTVRIRHEDGAERQASVADLRASEGLGEIENALIAACGYNLAGEYVGKDKHV